MSTKRSYKRKDTNLYQTMIDNGTIIIIIGHKILFQFNLPICCSCIKSATIELIVCCFGLVYMLQIQNIRLGNIK